jgi:hypothetical protein
MKPKDSKGPRKSAAKSAKTRTTSAVKRKTKAQTSVHAASAAQRAKRLARAPRLKIPPILLEGDAPATPAASGPGQRYALGPTPPAMPAVSMGAELPESYGTQQLFLTARDPQWLYAHWDFSREQLKRYSVLSADGHLVLRVYRGAAQGEPLSHIDLHPESRNWFVPVAAAGAKYVAELGYLDASRQWVSLARSGATLTPPNSLSDDTSIRFATIPPEVPFGDLLAMVKGAVREHVPLVEAMQQMRAQGFRDLPPPEAIQSPWTPAQEKALAEVISIDPLRRIWIGSLEITELIRRQLEQQVSSINAAPLSLPSAAKGGQHGVSSPFGGANGRRNFWFSVNAELVFYGATEPDAKVTVDDQPVKLRPDGTFSLRFALPDGEYALAAAAHSADRAETRVVNLEFRRKTVHRGEVGEHPPDKNLKPPKARAVE